MNSDTTHENHDDELSHEEHVELATECVERLHKARNYLHFAAGTAHAMNEPTIGMKIDGLKDDVESFIDDNFEEAPDFKHDTSNDGSD